MYPSTPYLETKICMVTGATSGIGEETARQLAFRGARVIIVGRNVEKVETVVHKIKLETGNPLVDPMIADLSSQRDIRRLACEFKDSYARLDVLINNVGSIFLTRRQSIDDIEMTFALNHLSYFLLTMLLLDVLKSTSLARVINVSSSAHQDSVLDFDNLQSDRSYILGVGAYRRSKLANLLFTYELARRLECTGVTVNALHPGLVATNLLAKNGVLGYLLTFLLRVAGATPKQGAGTSVYLAGSPDVEGITGHYYIDCQEAISSKVSYDRDVAARLWKISMELTGLSGADVP